MYEANELFTDEVLDAAAKYVAEEIEALNDFPLSELQQRLVNYLHANIYEVVEALGLEEEDIL